MKTRPVINIDREVRDWIAFAKIINKPVYRFTAEDMANYIGWAGGGKPKKTRADYTLERMGLKA